MHIYWKRKNFHSSGIFEQYLPRVWWFMPYFLATTLTLTPCTTTLRTASNKSSGVGALFIWSVFLIYLRTIFGESLKNIRGIVNLTANWKKKLSKECSKQNSLDFITFMFKNFIFYFFLPIIEPNFQNPDLFLEQI